jgi:site-specific DNA-adenine methylase
MGKRYGMIYMGSKDKILGLIRYIFEREFQKKFFIDLFSGGFAVSSFALQKTNLFVIANDLNEHVVDLQRELIFNDGKNLALEKEKWITREHFNFVRDNPENFPSWYVGYVLNVWSFGCNQKDYLYAKDLEESKEALHAAIVQNDFSKMEKLEYFADFKIPPESRLRKTSYRLHYEKRPQFLSELKNFRKEMPFMDLRVQHLERLEHMEHLLQTERLDAIKENAPARDRLKLMSMDWEDALSMIPENILENAVIYCDPPYENSKQYFTGKDFDYEHFWEWFRTCPYSVYVSSYNAPDDIKPINFELKNQLLDNGHRGDNKPKKKVRENIYWNGKGDPMPTMEDMLFNDE